MDKIRLPRWKTSLIGFFIFFLSGLLSCKKSAEHIFSENIYTAVETANFKITGDENSQNTIISVYNPWQGAEEEVCSLLILREGHTMQDYKGPILEKEAKRIVCMSSTHIAMLDALGMTDRIVGVSGKEYITNPKIRNSANIPDIGYEGNIDYETLISLKPDLVLLFSINGNSGMEEKLKEFKIPYLYIGDYVEDKPLGKTEWIIPIAEVVGAREKGIEKFKEISFRYNELKESIKDIKEKNPKVMVNAPFGDSWFMPSTESYVASMIADAGGDYIYNKNSGNSSLPIEREEALRLVSEADVWINIGNLNNVSELNSLLPGFNETSCVKNRKLYNNNAVSTPQGGNDCYESGVINPDLILKDLIKIFHPDIIESEFTYYHQLNN